MADIISKFDLVVDSSKAVAGLNAFTKATTATNTALAALVKAATPALAKVAASVDQMGSAMSRAEVQVSAFSISLRKVLAVLATVSADMAVAARVSRSLDASLLQTDASLTMLGGTANTTAGRVVAATTAMRGLGGSLGTVAATAGSTTAAVAGVAVATAGVGNAAVVAQAKTIGFFTSAHHAARKFETLMFSMKGMFAMFGAKWFVETIAGLEREMAILRAITKDPQKTNVENEANMAAFKAKAMDIGTRTIFSAESATKGMVELAKAGLEVTEVLKGSEDVLYLAHVGQLEIGTAAMIAARAMNMFQIKAEGLSHVTDILAFTSKHANTSVELLAGGLRYVGATASLTGQKIETVVAALGVLAKAGRPGFIGGSGLNVVLANLETLGASKARMKIVKAMGLAAEDIQGTESDSPTLKKLGLTEKDLRPSENSLESIVQKFKDLKLSAHDLEMVSEKLFGKRGGPTFAILVEHLDDYKKSVEALNSAVNKGIAATMSATIIDTLSGHWARLKGTIQAVFVMKADDTGTLRFLRDATVGARHLLEALAGIKSTELSKDQIEYYKRWADAITILTTAYIVHKAVVITLTAAKSALATVTLALNAAEGLSGLLGKLPGLAGMASSAAMALARFGFPVGQLGGAFGTLGAGFGTLVASGIFRVSIYLALAAAIWKLAEAYMGWRDAQDEVGKTVSTNKKGLVRLETQVREQLIASGASKDKLQYFEDVKRSYYTGGLGDREGVGDSMGATNYTRKLAQMSKGLTPLPPAIKMGSSVLGHIKTPEEIAEDAARRDRLNLEGDAALKKRQTALDQIEGMRRTNALAAETGEDKALQRWTESIKLLEKHSQAYKKDGEVMKAVDETKAVIDALYSKEVNEAIDKNFKEALKAEEDLKKSRDEGTKILRNQLFEIAKLKVAASGTKLQLIELEEGKRLEEALENLRKYNDNIDVLRARVNETRVAAGEKPYSQAEMEKASPKLNPFEITKLYDEEKELKKTADKVEANKVLLKMYEDGKIARMKAVGDEVGAEKLAASQKYEANKESLRKQFSDDRDYAEAVKILQEEMATARISDSLKADKILEDIKLQVAAKDAARHGRNEEHAAIEALRKDEADLASFEKLLDMSRMEDQTKLAEYKIQLGKRTAEIMAEQENKGFVSTRDLLKEFSKQMMVTFDDMLLSGKGFSAIMKDLEKAIVNLVYKTLVLNPLLTQMEKALKGAGGAGSALNKNLMTVVLGAIGIGPESKKAKAAAAAENALKDMESSRKAASGDLPNLSAGKLGKIWSAQDQIGMGGIGSDVVAQTIKEQIVTGSTQMLGNVSQQQTNVVEMIVQHATINTATMGPNAEGTGTSIMKSIMGALPGVIGAAGGGGSGVETLGTGSSTAGLTQLSSGLWQRGPVGRAQGGSLGKDTLSIVGEGGPELFIPTQAGTVIPHDKTMKILQAMKTGNMQLMSDLLPSVSKMKFAAHGADLRAGQPAVAGEVGKELFATSGAGAHDPSGPGVGKGQGGRIAVSMNVINNSSQPVDAKTSQPRFDGKRWIINTVLEDMARNGDIRKAFKQ